jgi:hypothetical protein
MAHVPGLRSPYDQVGGIVYFGRMLDKIRLHSKGALPADYTDMVGDKPGVFDRRCVLFLYIDYEALKNRTLEGGSDEELLAWAFEHGRKPSEEEIEVWNGFMTKRGWRDSARDRLIFRLDEAGLPHDTGLETMFDFIDADEGRPQRVFA